MIIVNPSFEIIDGINNAKLMRIEKAGRVSYKSDDNTINMQRTCRFISDRIKQGHESVLEHASITVRFVIDRGAANELVRHRLCAFTQESTRYCDYANGDKFPEGVKFVMPEWLHGKGAKAFEEFKSACIIAEGNYMFLRKQGFRPEEARSVLPLCTATEIYVTANVREWRHILKLRTAKDAHPDIRRVMRWLLEELYHGAPCLFEDIYEKVKSSGNQED